jgi:membrane protein required for beta-lactamase induction
MFAVILGMIFVSSVWYYVGYNMHDDMRPDKNLVRLPRILCWLLRTPRSDNFYDIRAVCIQVVAILSGALILVAYMLLPTSLVGIAYASIAFTMALTVLILSSGLRKLGR